MLRLVALLLASATLLAEGTGPAILETSEVAFAIEASNATSVSVVGDFNGWDAARTPLAKDATGTWKVRTDLRKGKVYDYAFVVDGHWVVDPKNPLRSSGGQLSVIEVPGGGTDAISGAGLEPIRAMLKQMGERLSYYGDEIGALRREMAAHTDTIAKKEAQIDLLRKDLDDARTEKVTLTKELTEARIRLDEVSQRYTTLKAEKDNHTDESDKVAKKANDLQKQYTELQAKMNGILQEKRAAEERAQKAEMQAKEAETRFRALDKAYMETSRDEKDDEEPLPYVGPRDPVKEGPTFGPPQGPSAPTKQPGATDPAEPPLDGPPADPELGSKPPEGRVLVVGTQTKYLMISLGRKHGVKIGDEYFIRRGPQTIAKLRIEKVQDDFSSAEVQGEVKMTDIAIDDPVVPGEDAK